MAHIYKEKKKILARLKRIRGQLESVEKKLEEENSDCYSLLQLIAASRGAMNGLMSELLKGHIEDHIMQNPNDPTTKSDKASLELIQLMKTYWK